MDCQTNFEPIISILGIIFTAIIAIIAINKTSRKNRIEKAHEEMINVLIGQFQIFYKMIQLLWGVSQRAHIYRMPENDVIETSYDRYWKEIQKHSEDTNNLKSIKDLFLPTDIIKKFNIIINLLNQARELAKNANPTTGSNHEEIEKIVNEVIKEYNETVNISRKYIGIDAVDKISSKDFSVLMKDEN